MYTPKEITEVAENEIFVFGSNEAGIHGAGAARVALAFGAQIGKGFGPEGNTFAIPTKDWNMEILPIEVIKNYVDRFTAYASMATPFKFLVTKVGCGLAGYKIGEIAPLFAEAYKLENVVLPEEFVNYLTL
jgi:hypothetical protein